LEGKKRVGSNQNSAHAVKKNIGLSYGQRDSTPITNQKGLMGEMYNRL